MTTTAAMNPFSVLKNFNTGNFDFTKFGMGNFDFNKMFGGFKLPVPDVETLMASQRKNVEALTEANRTVVAGMQAIMRRQGEILSETMSTATSAVQELTGITSAQEFTAKQVDLTKTAFEKAFANIHELADAVVKSADEALDIINKRIAEGLDEVKELAAKK